jgi:hypothetical protein
MVAVEEHQRLIMYLIDFTSCQVLVFGKGYIEITLVIPQVEINLSTIIQDVDLPMPCLC